MNIWYLVITLSTYAPPVLWPNQFNSLESCEAQAAEVYRATNEASKRPNNYTRQLYGACIKYTGR